MSPTQKDFSAENDSIRTMWKSSADRPCENVESDSWASDAESGSEGGLDSRKNSCFNIDDDDVSHHHEQFEGCLDSGFEDSGNFQASNDTNEEEKRSQSQERKIQSILRAEPQIFIVYDKKEQRKKKKQYNLSNEPRKSVGFIFPEGVKIPERVSRKRSPTPMRHLNKLKRKLRGESSVPWRPSAHTLGKSKPLDAERLKVDEGSSTSSQLVVRKAATLGDLKLKKVKQSELEDEDFSASENEQEGDFDANNSDYDDIDSKSEDGDDDVNKEEVEDEDLTISRRKALRYHLKNIQISSSTNNTPKKTIKKIPSFPTAGHGVGHAKRHYPHAPSHHHHHAPHFVPTTATGKAITTAAPSIIVTPPEDIPSLDIDSMSNMCPDPEAAEVATKLKHRRSSSQGSLDRVLYGIARLFDSSSPEPPARPGKIIRARYRRVGSEECLPSIE